jgi:hypothetical protein
MAVARGKEMVANDKYKKEAINFGEKRLNLFLSFLYKYSQL